jgi:hypothetical protein
VKYPYNSSSSSLLLKIQDLCSHVAVGEGQSFSVKTVCNSFNILNYCCMTNRPSLLVATHLTPLFHLNTVMLQLSIAVVIIMVELIFHGFV